MQEQGIADLYVARNSEDRIVAGMVVWRGPREWINAFNALEPGSRADRPNHVILWAAVRDAMEAGVTFDLGRAAPEQKGLVDFKRHWGGVPVQLAYDYWPKASGLNVGRRDSGKLALASRLWSRLPAAIAERGSVLYRYLG
jgi:hypothetical protein